MNVSVVITVFNKAVFVRAAVLSVLGQSIKPTEVIVVDDGSTDCSLEQIDDLEVRTVRQVNGGPGSARNRGIAESNGEWIAFLDGDDIWLPDHLAYSAQLHRDFPDAAILAGGYKEFQGEPPRNAEVALAEPAREVDFFDLHPANPGVWTSSVVIKRTALSAAGGFGEAFPGEDVELWIRLGLDNSVVLSSKVTALYRREGQGLTHDYLQAAEPERPPIFASLEAALADPRHQARHSLISTYRDRWSLLLARQALSRGNSTVARRYLKDVARINFGKTFLSALAILPTSLVRQIIDVRRTIRKLTLRARKSAQ